MSYSVIIPSYKRPEMLGRALRSVYAQSELPKVIYLIVDEVEDWERYAFLKEEFDERLQVTFTGGGFGGAKARNIGLDQAQEDFVFFLDDDDEWLPKKCELQLDEFNSRQELVAVTCSCFEIRDNGKKHLVYRDEEDVNRYIKLLNIAGGFSCYGIRRSGIMRSLRLNDDLRSAQDYEFYIRVSQHGKCGVVGEPLVLFYQHGHERITSSAKSHRRETLLKVLSDNVALFSVNERRFFEAKVEILTASDRDRITKSVLQYFRGCCMLVSSRSYPSLSLKILKRGARSVLSMVRRKCKSGN